MRLINVDTFELHEFHGNDIPKYGILSHTWGEDEVSLQDLQTGKGSDKAGYRKIVLACKQAKEDELSWAWVDTCCIDKTSSAELSEAINSMYRWYKESSACYAYLSDVGDEFPYVPLFGFGHLSPPETQPSRWFTRAWTLQELVAPRRLIFYNREWVEIGHRSDEKIAAAVSKVTRIPQEVIQGVETLYPYSVAQKFSWAAHRSSTRLEDRAYSLIGLFDINMPLLYGEGERAFVRLQEEILKETDDHSLLCWTVPKESPRAWTLESVFARSPDDFSGSGNIRGNLLDSGTPSAMTNRGLEIRLSLMPRNYDQSSHIYTGNSSCYIYDAALNASDLVAGVVITRLSIALVRTPQVSERHSQSVNRYARLATPTLGRTRINEAYMKEIILAVKSRAELIYIHKTLFNWEHDRFGTGGIHLQNIPVSPDLCRLIPASQEAPNHGFVVRDVCFSGLDREIHRTDSMGAKLIGDNMKWSPVYGCVVFSEQLRVISWVSHLIALPLVTPPQFAVFGIESAAGKKQYHILVAWDWKYVHFSVREGQFHPEKYRLDYTRVQSAQDKNAEQMPDLREELIDPSHVGTHKGNYRDMYGEIARTRTTIADYDTEFVLEREDPNTAAGEAAGNRLHFLIRTSFSKIPDTKPKKSLASLIRAVR